MTLDDVRTFYPHLGLALYAYDPSAPVTLEVHAEGGEVFTFTGATEADVIAAAFHVVHDDAQEGDKPDKKDTTDDEPEQGDVFS